VSIAAGDVMTYGITVSPANRHRFQYAPR